MKLPALVDMLKNGVHFGHRTSKRHPKMSKYIFQARSGIHIIDLEKTHDKLETALSYVKTVVANGGIILFVGTKWQAKKIISKYGEEAQMPYVNKRWLGGTLTNFGIVSNVIKKFKKLKKDQESGEFEKYTKKERSKLKHEIEKLTLSVGGIETLDKLPNALFLVDIKKERIALEEANKKGIPVIAMCDTNVNPEQIKYPIPANDDAIKSIELITSLIADAVKQGREEMLKNPPTENLKNDDKKTDKIVTKEKDEKDEHKNDMDKKEEEDKKEEVAILSKEDEKDQQKVTIKEDKE